jgi:selenocysteine-specific elongation factor
VGQAEPRRVVVGTAGHIDHGKTALVKALTGVDTDRWEEEKRRGITIDLGFAPLPLGDGIEASIVDVPGHEAFVRNMLAGATGIDVALLVIAADEGVMPQTEEHLAIVELLGVTRGVPVLTKRDLVDEEWLALVRADVTERLAKSRIPWEPPIAVSALAGVGLDELRATLRRVAGETRDRPAADFFRLPLDRVFALPGAGTVVTGSTWSGTVAVGETVTLLPAGRTARVRSIEVHGRPAERAVPGRRTALALVGVDRSELARGQVAVTGTGWRATRMFDAAVELLPSARHPLTARTRVRVHLGTAEILARAVQVRTLEPGGAGRARFVLETPLVARGNDRFVLRSFSPVSTIGGGVVLDPFPPPGRLRRRQLADHDAPRARLSAFAAEAGLAGIAVADLGVRLGLSPEDVTQVLADLPRELLRCDTVVVSGATVAGAAEDVKTRLERHHTDHPLDPGMSLQAMRAAIGQAAGVEVPPVVLDHVLETACRDGSCEVTGAVLRVRSWQPKFDARAEEARTELLAHVAAAEWRVPTVGELERDLGRPGLAPLLAHLVRIGSLEQVDQERYADPSALQRFRGALEAALGDKAATPAELRDRLGVSRKFLIPLLEWADRRGITRRRGDARTLARLTVPKADS